MSAAVTPKEPQVATQQSEVPQRETSAPPVAGERPVVKQRNVTRHAAPPPVAAERRVAKPVVEPQPPAAKKTTRDAHAAKPSNEALNAVRRFQDNLRDIPVSSYAADGTQRTMSSGRRQYRTSITTLRPVRPAASRSREVSWGRPSPRARAARTNAAAAQCRQRSCGA
jgi:hypothetical protein